MTGWDFLGHLIWPLLIAGVLWWLRRPIADFTKRITHVRIAGQDLFVTKTFDTIENLLESSAQAGGRPEKLPRAIEDRIMQVTARNPAAGLVQLDNEIERALRALSAGGNWLKDLEAAKGSLWQKLYAIRDQGSWNSETLEWMLLYSQIVSRMQSSPDDFSPGEFLQAVRFGLKILGQINAVERQHFIVAATDLPMYEDEACTIEIEGKRGVALYSTHDEQSDGFPLYQVFWSTRYKSFIVGREVTYEWGEVKQTVNSGYAKVPGVDGWVQAIVGWDFDGHDMTHLLSGYDPPPVPPNLWPPGSQDLSPDPKSS